MSPWNTWKSLEHETTNAALRELPPGQAHAALRLRVVELERQIAEKTLEADALREVGQAIGSMINIDDMLKTVADIVVRVTGTDLCLIYILDEETNELVLRGSSGLDEDMIGRIKLKLGEGITGWVAEKGTHVAINREAYKDERFKPVPHLLQDKYQSMLSVPLRGKEDRVGVINVRTNPPTQYSRVQIGLLDSIARQVGGAIENYKQYRKMERRATQLSTLSEISRTITSDLYLEEILELIVAMTAETLNFRICSIMLLDENKQELAITATQSQSKAYLKKPNVKLSESVAGRAILEGRPITVKDVRKTPGYQYPDIAKKEGLCSLIAVPMSVKNNVIGVLNCYTAEPQDFSDDEIGIVTALANQAAISIQNAKLMVQSAVLQEMHHRVKNSLQTIASLLRLQIRMGRFDSPEEALNQSISRIQSIATVHELLSRESLDDVSVRKLADTILGATAKSLVMDERNLDISVEGEDFMLPSGHATYVALILNELIQNAVEHGLGHEDGKMLKVRVYEDSENVHLEVINDGKGLPEDFDIMEHRHLGLKIVEMLTRDNLMGEFTLTRENGNTRAVVEFPK